MSRLRPLAGIVAACLGAECALRLFASGATLNGIPQGETYRQYSEGVATSHFLSDTSRATGNPVLPGAGTILILGDSHVPAVQLEDSQTMGSVLERLARSHGVPLNVRQFGWSGEGYGIARTLALGPELERRVHPARVVVVLSEGALRTYPVDAAGAVRLRSEPPLNIRNLNRAQRAAREVAHYSVLVHLLYSRLREVQTEARAKALTDAGTSCARGADDARRGILGELRRAFGPKLLVLYAPEVGLDDSDALDCWEALLLPQCRATGIDCISLRSGMIEARRGNVLTRGFHNTVFGEGHLNEFGHAMAAAALFERLFPATVVSRH